MKQYSITTYSKVDVFIYLAIECSLSSTAAVIFLMHEKQELRSQDLDKE